MFALEIDPRAYVAAGDRFVSDLAASSESILRAVAGAAVVEMAHSTPPGNGLSVRGASALAMGESTLKADAYSLMIPIPGAQSPEPVGQIVTRHRGPNGRVVRPAKKIIVSMGDFQAYLRKALPRVGYTAGGWNAAATALGRDLPPWMTDHPGPGSISIQFGGDVFSIEIRNEVPWFGIMSRNAEAALAPYERQLAETLERAARQAGARAGLT